MKHRYIMKLYIFGLTLSLLPLSSSFLYGKDLQRKGTIKVNNFDKNEHANLAKITLEEAVGAATQKVPGKAIEAELESEDGYLVYEVKVVSKNKKATDVFVDAGNAAILGTEEDNKIFG